MKKRPFTRDYTSTKGSYFLFFVYYGFFIITHELLTFFSVLRKGQFLYAFSEYMYKSFAILRHHTWNLIKCELFAMGGACQHSGQCCSALILFKQGRRIQTESEFTRLKEEDSSYTCFKPVQAVNGRIISFNCSNLTETNYCSDYNNRPQLCRDYPLSSFFNYDTIREGCGYKILSTHLSPSVRYAPLKQLLQEFCNRNKLEYTY